MKKRKFLKWIILSLSLILIIPLLVAFLAITFYKKELTDLLMIQAKETYGLNIKISDTRVSLFENWPNATIEAENVIAFSELSEKTAPKIFQAQAISVSFNLLKLLNKKFVVNSISLEHGTIALVKDKNGTTNFKFKKPADTTKSTSSVNFDLHKINLTDLKLDFKNEEKDKHIGILFRRNVIRLSTENKVVRTMITGNIKIEELLFKPSKGPFLKNAEAALFLNTIIYPAYQSFFVDESSYVIIDEEKYSLFSFVNLKEDEKQITLKINASNTSYEKGVRLMNNKIRHTLSKISVTNPVSVNAIIIAPIGKSADPELYVTMSGTNNNILIGNTKIPYKQVSFKGYLRSMGDKGATADLSNGAVVFNEIKGTVYDFPFKASVAINDLKDPTIKIKADLVIEGSKIKFKPGTDFILSGLCTANVDYKGDVKHLNNEQFLDAPQQLLLKVQFKKFSYQTAVNQPAYIINGKAEGFNKDISFKGIQLETVGGNFVIDGSATDFVPYAFGQKNGFHATVQAFTNMMDLTPMIAKSFNSEEKSETKVTKQEVKDAMDGAFSFAIGMKAKKLIIRNLVATDAYAEINYTNKTIEITKLNMKACNGTLTATGKLHNFTNLQANLNIKNMEVRTMFEQFENFGQKTISSEKLLGTISLTANMKARLNEKFQLQAPDLEGEVKLKLQDGHLLNFEPFQNIANYFRNRDFKDITFSEINQTFKIKGTEMNIQNLEVASNVVNIYIDGIYSFKGHSDLNLRIPLSNLKKRNKEYVPQSLGEEGKTARALLLNAHGLPNKIKITLGAHARDTMSTTFD